MQTEGQEKALRKQTGSAGLAGKRCAHCNANISTDRCRLMCARAPFKEIEKFIIRQPPKGEKDDYDSEISWISDGLPSSSRSTNQFMLIFVFLHAVQAEAVGHRRPAVWKALPTASTVLPVLDHKSMTQVRKESNQRYITHQQDL